MHSQYHLSRQVLNEITLHGISLFNKYTYIFFNPKRCSSRRRSIHTDKSKMLNRFVMNVSYRFSMFLKTTVHNLCVL